MLLVPVETQIEIEQFLFHEARLLDGNRLDEWLELLADDIRYLMPIREAVEQPAGDISALPRSSFELFDDDKQSLTVRVRRMQSKLSPTESPAALVQRFITNVQVQRLDGMGGYQVRSNFLVHQERRGRHTSTFIGYRQDLLRREQGILKIAGREIHLAQTILPASIALFF